MLKVVGWSVKCFSLDLCLLKCQAESGFWICWLLVLVLFWETLSWWISSSGTWVRGFFVELVGGGLEVDIFSTYTYIYSSISKMSNINFFKRKIEQHLVGQ